MDLGFVRNIAGFRQDLLTCEFADEFVTAGVEFVFVSGAEHHVRAFAQVMLGDDFAESLAAAGDERVETFQFHERGRVKHDSSGMNTKSSNEGLRAVGRSGARGDYMESRPLTRSRPFCVRANMGLMASSLSSRGDNSIPCSGLSAGSGSLKLCAIQSPRQMAAAER